MRRQRNMAQMKEQIKTPEKELNKMEISNLSDKIGHVQGGMAVDEISNLSDQSSKHQL